MNIKVFRDEFSNGLSQYGEIHINGIKFCESLENATLLIPSGNYKGKIYLSPHFGYHVILIQNVSGREFIEMHKANWYHQLKGCIAPGMVRTQDGIGQSKIAFDHIMFEAELAESIDIEVL